MAGVFTAEERVVRDGVLIAFAGEVMTNEEAMERGLLVVAGEEQDSKPKAKTPKEELIERAEALGIDLPKKATMTDIEKLIAEAEAEAAAAVEAEAVAEAEAKAAAEAKEAVEGGKEQ